MSYTPVMGTEFRVIAEYFRARRDATDGRTYSTTRDIEECRKLNWTPFRASFFARCPECKVDHETFLDELNEQLKLIAAGKPTGWPYEMKGNVRQWYGNLSRDEALKICRENASNWLTGLLGSKHACVE